MGDPLGSPRVASLLFVEIRSCKYIYLFFAETASLGQAMGALRMGVTGGVMRRCAWRLGRWGAG